MPVAAVLLAERDISHTVNGVHESLSSWDGCMAHSYCKWPVIIGIVMGSLMILSMVWCVARCLCCGVECCCGFLSCCNACCPSPRGRRRGDNSGYQQAPPTPHTYQPPPPMNPYAMSGGAGAAGSPRGATSVPKSSTFTSTAKFDAPTKKYNDDALPAMPSWDNAKSHRVEETVEQDVELEKMDRVHSPPPAQQQQALLASKSSENLPNTDRFYEKGDIGAATAAPANAAARPYHDYPPQSPQQFAPNSPYGSQRGPPAPGGYFTGAQVSPMQSPYGSQHGSQRENAYPRAGPYGPPSAQNPPPPSRSYRSPASAGAGGGGGYHMGPQTSPQPYPSRNDYYGAHNQPHQQQQQQQQSHAPARMPQADFFGGNGSNYNNNSPHERSDNRARPPPPQQLSSSYAQPRAYEAAPSYQPPAYGAQGQESGVVSPVTPEALTPGAGAGRRPVQGGWREY